MLGDAESLLLQLEPGEMSLEIEAEIVDNRLRGKIFVQQNGVNMQIVQAANIPEDSAMLETLNDQIAAMEAFNISVDLAGTLAQPEMQLESDLGPHIADLLGNAFQSTVSDLAQGKARELRGILDQQLQSLDQLYSVNTTDILQLLSSEVTEIADLEQLLEGRNLTAPTFR